MHPAIPGERMLLPCHLVSNLVHVDESRDVSRSGSKKFVRTALLHKEVVDQPRLPHAGGDRNQCSRLN